MNRELLEKFFKNACTEEEVQEVLRWFNSPENKDITLSSIEDHWFDVNENKIKEKEETDEILNRIYANIGKHRATMKINPERKNPSGNRERERTVFLKDKEIYKRDQVQGAIKNRAYYNYGTRIAASIILGVCLSIFAFQYFNVPDQSGKSASINYIEKSNPRGQKLSIFLSDGSKVILNSESKLTYPEEFTENARTLYLEGEAFFEVAHDKDRPFTVTSGTIATTALGTSFNVRAYPEEATVQVSLATGKVKVKGKKDSNNFTNNKLLILDPGEGVTYDKASKILNKGYFDVKKSLAWKEGIIYFKDANFDEIIGKLERWYGVEFEIINGKNEVWHYTGEFNNESLENVLMGIGFSKSFKYEIKDENVIINFKNN